ncbi:diguanylate cyclase [Aquincola sp. S2]|uniref:Diguanylate cyclase n=1 Tax=Pseudaquabacterium terrae TaxID=2732868 RepID=A0ABX2ER50_9BURK|nr:diguanylate cyclase [Aquabacterium terrae]NRF71103.1 diguanylate cyclase [Aquabacterium terrae]
MTTLSAPFARRSVAVLGALLALFGLFTMAGWLLRQPQLVRLVPGFLMVFDTALGFTVAGLALLAGVGLPAWRRTVKTAAGVALAALGLLVLAEYGFGADFGIDGRALHTWLIDPGRNPFPGRPSRATALGMVLAGSIFLVVPRARTALHRLGVGTLAAMLGALGLLALIGYLLGLPGTLDFYFLSQVALPTASGFVLLALALWLDWRVEPWSSVALQLSLRRRLSLALLALTLPSLAVTLSITYLQMRQAATANAVREVEGKVVLAAKHLDELVNTFANSLRVLSVNPVLHKASVPELEAHFRETLNYLPMLASFELVDRDGVIVATTRPENRGRRFAQLHDAALEALRRQAQDEPPDALFIDVQRSESALHALSGAADGAGRSFAVLVATLDRRHLLQRIADVGEGSGDGDGDEYAYLLDGQGRIVASVDPDVTRETVHPLAAALRTATAQRGSFDLPLAHAGTSPLPPERLLSSYARLGPFGDNRFADWTLVHAVPAREVLEPMHRLFGFVATVAATMAGAAVLLGLKLARSIYRPVRELSAAATRLGEGDASARAGAASGVSELDGLARSFNRMAERIVASQRAMQDSHEALRALGESNAVAAAVITSAAEGVMVLDAELRIESINPAFGHITGFSPAESLGRTPRLLFSGRHDDEFFRRIREAADTTGHWHGEIWNRRRSGEVYPQQTSISLLRDADGRVSHYAAVFSDSTERHRLEARLRELASVDGLTGIANRRVFDEVLARECQRAQRSGPPLSLVMADIDHFKRYNDRHGHQAGDDCLRQVARAIATAVGRVGDLAARYGGEEFAVVLPNTDAAAAALVAERIRAAVAALALPHGASETAACVTVSLGVATLAAQPLPGAADTPQTLLARADQALYRAKAAGRNRVATAANAASPAPDQGIGRGSTALA